MHDPDQIRSGHIACLKKTYIFRPGPMVPPCSPHPPLLPHPTQGLFMERAIAEFKGGKVEEAILFLKVAIGQKWFSRVSASRHHGTSPHHST